MIPAITEHFGNEAQWATLHQATVTLSDMGDRTISTQVRIDGDHVPNFSNWWLEFKGEKFILPIRDPQALKDNSSRNSIIDLTFYSWATYQMKRFFFMSLSQISANVAIPNKYNASIVMPVENFVELFNKVLRQYFGNKIRMDLYNMGQGYYSNEPVAVEINNTYIWDVLIKFYELFNLRWRIVYEQATDTYAIKVNYPAEVLADHDFEYGYEGGLLRFERQVQDDDIRNILLGRGGERNLPYRYFKLEDEAAGSVWAGDPDAIPELSNIYFERLRDINFRWYVRGWMHNPNRDTSGDEAWDPGHVFPTYEISDTDPHYWAYQKGLTDLNFDPVEYEKDDESIAKFGERWGALDDNDDIYPTIQGVEVTGLGRIDEICGVSDIITDDIDAAAKSAATEVTIGGAVSKTVTVPQHGTASCDWTGDTFTVPAGSTGILTCQPTFSAKPRIWHPGDPPQETYKAYIRIEAWSIEARDENGNSIISTNGTLAPIPAGTYRLYVTSLLANDGAVALETTFALSSPVLTTTLVDADAWKPTFDIWVKNIWQTEQGTGETDAQYATRVWEKILGDRAGNEAKVVFSDGFMSLSEDYNFVIASYPVVDRSKTLPSGVRSEWKITLYKSDAEYDATGKFIPNADASAKPVAGDHFFFTGIDMPHQYVIWAEERINQNKVENLDEVKDINPSWVIGLDKVRVHTQEAADQAGLLADRLAAGTMITIKDRRFTNNQQLSLYIQTLTYTWQEPTQDSPYLVPDIEVVLSDKVVAVGSPVEKLNNDVSVIRSTYAKVTDIEDVVRRVATPLFLKKTGESDSSESPTSFGSAVRSKSFRQGAVGGEGWGHYLDGEGHSVLELDKLVVRQELQVNSLVANQISSVGGREILSAASMQCIQVVETDDSYICYFDQRRGTVANLFRVGDFAMGQQFDPDNTEQRYYRARVTAVDSDSITLSKAVKDGAGVPVVGDTIVQYGSDTDSSRQYVIVRDVIGGGYERMISGLTTVNAAGTEYYFAGRQNGSTPRWFVGDSNGEYAEWQNGILNIKGRVSVRKSDGSYQAMDSYIAGINSSLVNLQDQIDGAVQTWAGNVAPTLNNYPASAWTDTPTRNNHLGDLYYDTETGHGYRFMYTEDDGFFWFQLTDEDVTLALAEAARANAGVAGLQYLKTALADGATIVEGGLVLTNLIQLGKTENGVFNVYSGINGLVDTTALGNGIAAWYGGPMADKEATPTPASYAKSLFRFDGSGYLASGNIGWDASGAGHIPGISWQGNSVIISGDVKLASLSGDSVTELLTLVRNLNNWFGEDENTGDIYVKKRVVNGAEVARNFYSFGSVAAYGVNGSGGGGGGVDLARVWESLTTNTDAYGSSVIHHAHIPSITLLPDANRLAWKAAGDPGTPITVDDQTYIEAGVLQVQWGAYGDTTAILSVGGTEKNLLLAAALTPVNSAITTLQGYFTNGVANNAARLGGELPAYYATASGLSSLATTVAGLVTGVSSVVGQTGAVSTSQIASALTSAGYKLTDTIYTLPIASGLVLGGIKIGNGLTIDSEGTVSVTGQTQGTVTRIDVGSAQYSPNSNGVVGLPAYPTSLPASDVYSWAKASTKPSYNLDEVSDGTTRKLSDYFLASSFTKANIQSTLGISNWALEDLKPSYSFNEIGGSASASQVPSIENLTNFSTKVYDASASRVANTVLAAPNGSNGAASFRTLVADDIPSLTTSKISNIDSWVAGKGYLTGFDVEGDDGNTLQISSTLIVNGGSNVTVAIDNGRLLISATDTTYSDATTSASGLMSATDKGRLDAIYAKVPAAAYNAGNEIADKAFVNSSIATATATYQGNYNVVTDLSLAYNASHAQIESALDSLLVNVDDNDYCFVEIPVSGDSGAPIGRTERYKFNGTNWSYEYALNNSGFTANQWAAINSGITSALVTAFGNKYDKPSGGIPSTDLESALQTAISNGATAYGWGNHANAGYMLASNFTQANIKSTLGISNWALAANAPASFASVEDEDGTSITATTSVDNLRIAGGSNASVKVENGVLVVSATDTTYSSLVEDEGGTAVSLVTTGEKYLWNRKANASEMSVVAGTGDNADKVTITLKSGTSATVLTTHQSLANYVTLNGTQTISGGKTFTADTAFSMSVSIDEDLVVGGDIEAESFKVTGGTSSQFLKADGSIDSNAYLTQHQSLTNHAKVADTSTAGQALLSTSAGYSWITLGSMAFYFAANARAAVDPDDYIIDIADLQVTQANA